MGINKVILLGHVGKDPEIQYVKEDIPIARFTLATSESYKDKNGEKVTNTEWHNIVVWRGLAKVVESYVKKGSQLYLEGKITTRSYEKDGQTKYFTEVVANNMEMLGGKNAQSSVQDSTPSSRAEEQHSQTQQNQSQKDIPDTMSVDEEDDLPF